MSKLLSAVKTWEYTREKPCQCRMIVSLSWNQDIHSLFSVTGEMRRYPKSSHQIHGNKNRTQNGQTRECVVSVVIRLCHLNTDLRKIIRMRPGQNGLIMIQILHHRNNMIYFVSINIHFTPLAGKGWKGGGKGREGGLTLNITQIQSNFTPRRNLPLLVTPFTKPLDHICFTPQQSQ